MMYSEVNAKAIEDIYSILDEIKVLESDIDLAMNVTCGENLKGEIKPLFDSVKKYIDMLESTMGQI